MFRATKGSGVTITTIFRNNAIETRTGNKIHHLREKRSACVHCAPDWKTKIGEYVTSRILDRVQGATKINASETLVLQRYFEIAPSVNRTAVKKLQRKSAPSFRSLLFNTLRECRGIYGLINAIVQRSRLSQVLLFRGPCKDTCQDCRQFRSLMTTRQFVQRQRAL